MINTSLLSYNWIIDKKTDLVWFIFSAFSAYILIFMYGGLGWDMVTIWFFWVTFIDTPHFFGTYTRTYFDKVEFKNRKKLLLGSLLWFLLGPIVLLISYVLYQLDATYYEIPWFILIAFFSLWAYWHVVRQHFGFLSLYKKKNKENTPYDYYLDSTLLYSGLLLPFIVFASKEPEARGLIMSLIGNVSIDSMNQVSNWLAVIVIFIILFIAILYIIRQVQLYRNNIAVNMPKSIFLFVVVTLHIFICYSPITLSAGLLGFGAFVTIFHDFQYHAIVWFHHKNRYKGENVFSKFGLASKIASSLPIYIGSAVLMGLLFRFSACSFQIHPGCVPYVLTSELTLFGTISADKLLLGVLLGIAMNHYYLDQKIWRTSKDKQLNKDLNLE